MTDRLKATSRDPLLQTVLEWSGGLDVDKAAQVADLCVEIYSNARLERFRSAFAACESPSERQFLLGALLQAEKMGYRPFECQEDGAVLFCDDDSEHAQMITLYPQVEFFWCQKCGESECDHNRGKPFARCDFVLEVRGNDFAIEIDGHDYHDRTKEQAAADRSRDRRLLLSDVYAVIRFTASEIYKDPLRAFTEALAIAQAQCGREGMAWEMGSLHGRQLAEQAQAPSNLLVSAKEEVTTE